MNAPRRFAEVGRLVEHDQGFGLLAQEVIAVLEALTEESIGRLRRDEAMRDELFKGLWDRHVESPGRAADSSYDAWHMSMEGVLVDDLIRLWTDEPHWRARISSLIPSPEPA